MARPRKNPASYTAVLHADAPLDPNWVLGLARCTAPGPGLAPSLNGRELAWIVGLVIGRPVDANEISQTMRRYIQAQEQEDQT